MTTLGLLDLDQVKEYLQENYTDGEYKGHDDEDRVELASMIQNVLTQQKFRKREYKNIHEVVMEKDITKDRKLKIFTAIQQTSSPDKPLRMRVPEKDEICVALMYAKGGPTRKRREWVLDNIRPIPPKIALHGLKFRMILTMIKYCNEIIKYVITKQRPVFVYVDEQAEGEGNENDRNADISEPADDHKNEVDQEEDADGGNEAEAELKMDELEQQLSALSFDDDANREDHTSEQPVSYVQVIKNRNKAIRQIEQASDEILAAEAVDLIAELCGSLKRGLISIVTQQIKHGNLEHSEWILSELKEALSH